MDNDVERKISQLEEDVKNLLSTIQKGLVPEDGMDITRLEDAAAHDEWKDHYAFPAIARAMLAMEKPHLIETLCETLWMICQMQQRIEALKSVELTMICQMQQRIEALKSVELTRNARQKPQDAPGCDRSHAPVVDGRKEEEGPITKMVANGAELTECDENDRWWEDA